MSAPTYPFPANVQSGPVRAYASELAAVAAAFEAVDNTLDLASTQARQSWTGVAADTFAHHMNNRGHVFERGSAQVRMASGVLAEFATRIDQLRQQHARTVQWEAEAEASRDPYNLGYARAAQAQAVTQLHQDAAVCAEALGGVCEIVDAYTERSFIPVGAHTTSSGAENLTGGDLLAQSLMDTTESVTGPDEIRVRKLDDGSYIVALPGVTDLSSNLLTPGNLVNPTPQDRVRKVFNLLPSIAGEGYNPYTDGVKIALQRAGVPAGANVVIVGHSYGAYTAIDLAGDDDFNSADGDSDGYHVNITGVAGFGADTDWKFDKVPDETDVLMVNNRDDVLFQAERRFNPTSGESVEWALKGGPIVSPFVDLAPVPWHGASTTAPTGNLNQLEVEINAGRMWGDKEDGYASGHHQQNYSDVLDDLGGGGDVLIRKMFDGRHVVESFNVRVPDHPSDTVPPVATTP